MSARDSKYTTVIFEGNIRDLPGSPFAVESAFGKPVIVAIGNMAEERDALEEELEALKAKFE